jgi:hypothetical protein
MITGSHFSGRTEFRGSAFVGGVSLRNCRFEGLVDFTNTTFVDFADLRIAEYGDINSAYFTVNATQNIKLPEGWTLRERETASGLADVIPS